MMHFRFGSAKPTRVTYVLDQGRGVGVVYEYGRLVDCVGCTSPYGNGIPRGRVASAWFTRKTHHWIEFRLCSSREECSVFGRSSALPKAGM